MNETKGNGNGAKDRSEYSVEALARRLGMTVRDLQEADELTRKVTAFESFERLLAGSHEPGFCSPYTPSLRKNDPRAQELADLYDAAQANLGSTKRAYRS